MPSPSFRPSRKRWMERTAYLTLFSLVGFWILAVFALVYHSMSSDQYHAVAQQRVADAPKQPHELLRAASDGQVPDQGSLRRVKPEKSVAVPKPQATAAVHRHPLDLPKYMSPLLIFTCKRADYLKQTMMEVLNYMPKTCEIGCPLIISQDGNDPDVAAVIQDFTDQYEGEIPIVHLKHDNSQKVDGAGWQIPYKRLAIHYGWALQQTFDGLATPGYPSPDRVIILEEDLHVSPDFFEYFGQMAPLLDQDSTLLTVSSFNDNGKEGKIKDPTRVLRSDFFPGLGWMMNRKLWDTELASKWPGGYWDDWLREPAQRQGRHILRPEISRTFHFGTKGGASKNQFGSKLSEIHLNTEIPDWAAIDLSNLKESTFDRTYFSVISMAQPEPNLSTALVAITTRDVRVEYNSFKDFKRLAAELKIMDDEKAGIPRTAYRGVVEIRPLGDFILFLTPPIEQLKSAFHL